MKRGIFGKFTDFEYTENVSRSWIVTFLESNCYWYDLIINPPEGWDSRKRISAELNEKKKLLADSIDKRFIYFLASRPKVRFDTTQKVKKKWFAPVIIVPVVVWPDRKKTKIQFTTASVDEASRYATPSVELTDTMIKMNFRSSQVVDMSIHDFLQLANTGIGQNSQVRYVGSTKDPASRLLSRKHRGLTDTIYNVGSENSDFFLYVNVCHIQSNTIDPGYGLNIYTTNSLTDELDIEDERHIVEGALIEYFQCSSQKLNKEAEKASFVKRMRAILKENKISRVAVWLGIENEDEYFTFFSTEQPAKAEHIFSFELCEDLEMTQYADHREMYQAMGIDIEV